MGNIQYTNNDVNAARRYFQKAQALLRLPSQSQLHATLLMNIGNTYLTEHRTDSALYYFHQARNIFEGTPNQRLASTYYNLALSHQQWAQADSAHGYFQKAADYYRVQQDSLHINLIGLYNRWGSLY
ncbi:MAG: tetratricopeptide repeat protein, partial [Bacteroidia bacterium]|nr:tetratricopeptide repeat protein [Bacteroidia bacterium]